MDDRQREHRGKIMQKASVLLHKKYEAGAIQHGGVLSDKSKEWLLDSAIEEALDQLVYLLTLKDVMEGEK